MSQRILRSAAGFVLAIVLLLSPHCVARADKIEYDPVSRGVIEARLGKYIGSDQQRESALVQMFRDSGCGGDHLYEQHVKGAKLPNVICVLPGSSEKVIIVGAHFDHVSEGDGVVDNWSGASILPSLYEAIRLRPRKHTYVFVGFTDEEKGEVGSRFYARQMSNEDVAATQAMVNMDTLGLGPTQVWKSHADKGLANAMVYIAKKLDLPIGATNVDYIGSSDSVQFSDRKIPSITIHSLTQEAWDAHLLHTNKDKISAMHLDEYYQTYRLVAAYLALLDEIAGLKASGR